MRELTLISGPTHSGDDERVVAFATGMGVSVRTAALPVASAALPADPAHADRCLAMSADTLAVAHRVPDHRSLLERFIDGGCSHALVFGCQRGRGHDEALRSLTAGAVRSVISAEQGGNPFYLPTSGRVFTRQFAGLEFSTSRRVGPQIFDVGALEAGECLLGAQDGPVFLRLRRGSCELFLLAGSEAVDVRAPLSSDADLADRYDQIVPLLIFLRTCFGDCCWHNPVSMARLIIDDPLLGAKYGYLDYRSLSASMRGRGYGTSIAFIPWNYKRTSRRMGASLGENLSVCVHGCDHTNKEFASTDEGVVRLKASTALARMERHEQRTGVPWDRVMVFPQGHFSSAAARALRASGYLAAVNSTCFPTDCQRAVLSVRDLLRPAVTRFDGFPIFLRRYPKNIIDFAFDLFLGRPVLIVEHHEYFRNGLGRLEEFVDQLQRLDPKLSWTPLSVQLRRSCQLRRVSGDSVQVRFFTPQFELHNSDENPTRFLLSKHEPDPSFVRGVLANGVPVPFAVNGERLEFEIRAAPGEVVAIRVVDHPWPVLVGGKSGVAHALKVAVRRGLSEFRDNVLAKHPAALQSARRLARGLKMTGDC